MTEKGSFDIEQVLYYTIPGELLIALFLGALFVLHLNVNVDAAVLTAALLVGIPVGFTLYQAYHSNFLGVRKLVNRKEPEFAIQRIEHIIEKNIPVKVRGKFAGRILDLLADEHDESGYSNFVRNLVNSKGACLLASFVGMLIPLPIIAYNSLSCWLSRPSCSYGSISGLDPAMITSYYAVLLLLAAIFYSGNDSLLVHRSMHNELLVSHNRTIIAKLSRELGRDLAARPSWPRTLKLLWIRMLGTPALLEGIILLIVSVIGLLGAIALPAAFLWTVFVFGVSGLLLGITFYRIGTKPDGKGGRPWEWNLGVFVYSFSLAVGIVGMELGPAVDWGLVQVIIGLIALYYLSRRRVKGFFFPKAQKMDSAVSS